MARAGLNAERVTRAAADLADEVGLEQLTVAAVARGFGVADASLYAHVRNLAELRERVAALAMAELAEVLGDAVAGRSGRAALEAFADAYRDFALGHPGRYAATQLAVGSEAALTAGARIVAACAALLRAYELDELDGTDAIRLLCSTFHGWVTLERAQRFRSGRPMDASWRVALAALDGALRHWPAEPGPPTPADSG